MTVSNRPDAHILDVLLDLALEAIPAQACPEPPALSVLRRLEIEQHRRVCRIVRAPLAGLAVELGAIELTAQTLEHALDVRPLHLPLEVFHRHGLRCLYLHSLRIARHALQAVHREVDPLGHEIAPDLVQMDELLPAPDPLVPAPRLGCDLRDGHAVGRQTVNEVRLHQRVDVFPLQVLDQRHALGRLDVHVQQLARNEAQAGRAAGDQPTVACDHDIVSGILVRNHGESLDESVLPDGLGQVGDVGRRDGRPGIPGRVDEVLLVDLQWCSVHFVFSCFRAKKIMTKSQSSHGRVTNSHARPRR